MYTVGEGEEQQTFFEVGDDVRIKDGDHAFCGLYGTVIAIQDDELVIEAVNRPTVSARQDQVEAN